jgi:glycosyltransferase involved in cell wall biosynthesis
MRKSGEDAVALLYAPVTAMERQAPPLQILFVGMLSEAKGVLTLLEACGQLAARGVSFHLEMMGQFQTAAFSVLTKRLIDELGISSHVAFLGVVSGDAKWETFARSDVVCLPTHHETETFPTVLLEAMSLARPIVATQWRGILEIVDDGKTGFLVPTHDFVAVADRLEELSSDAELRDRMGKAGRQKFIGEFTVDRFVQRMEKVFLETAQA